MNQQTLSYHTRLHDWYRQHSIQQEKQTEALASSKPTNPSSDLIALGILTRDKLHFINEWCSDVNRTMFSIKKKEVSPLYRKCRLSAPIKAAMKDKLATTRRVRSAEVFTLRDQWTKAPKVNILGGELLANSRAVRSSASHSEGRRVKGNNSLDVKNSSGVDSENVDFCVTNSLDKSNNVNPTMPRVNHDSFERRLHPSVIKKNSSNNIRSPVISPRGTLTSQCGNQPAKTNVESPEPPVAPRAKSASILRTHHREIERAEDNEARQGSAKTLPKNHKVPLSQNEANKIERTKKQKHRATSASQKSIKASTDLNTSVGEVEIKGILNDSEPDNTRGDFPTFCGKCSGIYSGNAPPPPTPVTCGSCVHGITMNGKHASQGAQTGPSNAEIQKELAQKLVETEKTYNNKITNANIQLKMAENRVTEDSIHYTLEREILRDGQRKLETLLPKTDEDFPDDADLSIENCDDNDISLDTLINSENNADDYRSPENFEENENDKATDKINSSRQIPVVTIVTDRDHDTEYSLEANEKQNSDADDHRLAASSNKRRRGRRMSIHFTYKPVVGNISLSNKLLHFLSIDDCKQAMRYYPHKILEKHEVTDDPILMLQNNLAFQGNEDGANDNETTSSNGKVAMRISKGSTITSLPSSTAHNATNVNKKQYKILFDPEDLDYYRNKRPSSMSLARAFNTLIYDRTIMQRLEEKGSGPKSKALNNVGKTPEGPKYRLINNALKKQIGERMNAQCQEMVQRYQRRKSGMSTSKRQAETGTPCKSSDRSLSLESLPSVKKGIWSDHEEPLN